MARIPDENAMIEPPIEYLPARYVTGQRNYVEFSAWHPEQCKMVRKRTYFDRVSDVRARFEQAQRYADKINVKLGNGWRPWHDDGPTLGATLLLVMLQKFLEHKARTLRARSLPNYISRVKTFTAWINHRGWGRITCMQLTGPIAVAYFDHLASDGQLTARTINNYLIDMRAMGNWAKKRGYLAQNPFQAVAPLKKTATEKRPLTDGELKAIMARIRDFDAPFYVVCCLVYYAALRPEEITRLKCSQIDVARGMLRLTAQNTKDNQGAWVTLPKQAISPLARHVAGSVGNNYAFSAGLMPGPNKIFATRLAERWATHRKALGFGADVRLYGLKDTALMRLLATGASPATVRDHARHSSLEVTDAYIKTLRGFADAGIRNNYPDMV